MKTNSDINTGINETDRTEIAAGFGKAGEVKDVLKANYFGRFRKL